MDNFDGQRPTKVEPSNLRGKKQKLLSNCNILYGKFPDIDEVKRGLDEICQSARGASKPDGSPGELYVTEECVKILDNLARRFGQLMNRETPKNSSLNRERNSSYVQLGDICTYLMNVSSNFKNALQYTPVPIAKDPLFKKGGEALPDRPASLEGVQHGKRKGLQQ